jgi:hypothetical protein
MKTYISTSIIWPLLFLMATFSQAQTITSTAAGGNWDNPATWVGGTIPTAGNDVIITGPVRVTGGAQCRNITVNSGADLANSYYEQTLRVNGNITNNGRLTNWYSVFTLHVVGNIINNGVWEHSVTKFIGGALHQISMAAGTKFASQFESDPGTRIIASSDLHFTRPVKLNNGTFDLLESRVTLEGDGNIRDGTAIHANEIRSIGGASLSNIVYEGDIRLLRYTRIANNVTMRGSVVNVDTLVNSYYEYTLVVEGNFTNFGLIQNTYSSLRLNITGNVFNNGIWNHSFTNFIGTSNTTISQGTGKFFQSDMTKTHPGSVITLASDIHLKRYFDLGGAVLNAQGRQITLEQNGNIRNGRVINTSNLRLYGGAALSNIVYEGDIILRRYVRIGGNVRMIGSVTVADTLVNDYYEHNLDVDGSFTNNGLVQNTYSSLILTISGNVLNNGQWLHYRTFLDGGGTRTIGQTAGKKFDSEIITAVEGSTLNATSPLHFKRPFNLGKGTLNAQQHTIMLESTGNINNGQVTNTRDLRLFGGAGLSNITYVGSINLRGVVQIGNFVTMQGPVTVIDTLQNNYYGYTLYVDGDFENRGLVRNSYSSFSMEVTGNVKSTGTMTMGYLDMVGSGYRNINTRGITANVRSTGENVVLIGDNYITNLTITGSSKTRLGAGARIFLTGRITGYLDNYGEIHETYFTNRHATVSFFNTATKVVANGGIDSLHIVAMGRQVPETFGNAVQAWWEFIPKGPNVALNIPELYLYYDPAILGGNSETTLEVYHSEDDGVTWRQISTSMNRTRDQNANWVRITDAPASGHYLLSSQADPISVRTSIILTVIGRTDIRVGPPNRYTVHYVNNSPVSTGDFFIRLASEGGVFIESVEPSAPPGEKPRSIPIDSLTYDGVKNEAILWVESLEPHEERTFDVIMRAYPDKATASFGIGPEKTEAIPLLLVAAWWATKAIAVAVVADVTINMAEEIWRPVGPCETVSGAFKEALKESVNKTRKRWTGWEQPTKQVLEDAAEKLVEDNGIPISPISFAKKGLDATGKTINGAKRYLNNDFKVKDCDGNETTIPGDVSGTSKTYRKVTSWDPNEKVGPEGVGAQGFITSAGRMHYQILFENLAKAQAPAWRIIIVDTLSAAFDPTTVEFGRTSHDGAQYKWNMTRNGNILRWEIEDIELPPNINPPEGEGYVTFSVMPKAGLASGTVLSNRADIKFDFNASILTNTVVNTLDFTAPTSTMTDLAAELLGPKITVQWSCVDGENGSGTESFVLYASKDGGAFLPVGTTDQHWMTAIVEDKSSYEFYVLAKDRVGNVEAIKPAVSRTTIVGMVVGLEDEELPYTFNLGQNFPNPFNPTTIIPFSLPSTGTAKLEIYSLLGQRVATLIDREMPAGNHTAQWKAGHLASGMYLYRLSHNGEVMVKKMVLVK